MIPVISYLNQYANNQYFTVRIIGKNNIVLGTITKEKDRFILSTDKIYKVLYSFTELDEYINDKMDVKLISRIDMKSKTRLTINITD
jgi:hypothetical protein